VRNSHYQELFNLKRDSQIKFCHNNTLIIKQIFYGVEEAYKTGDDNSLAQLLYIFIVVVRLMANRLNVNCGVNIQFVL